MLVCPGGLVGAGEGVAAGGLVAVAASGAVPVAAGSSVLEQAVAASVKIAPAIR